MNHPTLLEVALNTTAILAFLSDHFAETGSEQLSGRAREGLHIILAKTEEALDKATNR